MNKKQKIDFKVESKELYMWKKTVENFEKVIENLEEELLKHKVFLETAKEEKRKAEKAKH